MNILCIGDKPGFNELKAKFGINHNYFFAASAMEGRKLHDRIDVVFDFIIDEDPTQIDLYKDRDGLVVFLNSVKLNLKEIAGPIENELQSIIFGFNGMPSFINRSLLELTLFRNSDKTFLEKTCKALGTDFRTVDDRTGMVTPRVVCMIINEAYLTVEDGTASRDDIDLAMKLGTNYPYGPFEWANRIGIRHVHELLDAVYRDTKDERYRVSELLKSEYKAIMTR